ncbi:MAG TPA: cupin domain-containing protein [Polyangiaceae bacterium]
MARPILNIEELEFRPWSRGDKFEAKLGAIGLKLGAQKLGYNLTVLPPGKKAFPFHNHRVNEEMFFILEGSGEVRIGSERHAIRVGDVIACPAGGPETAHQIVNTSQADLKYLAVSTTLSPDIAEYPDSKKYGVLAQLPNAEGKLESVRFITHAQATADDYWQGEE